jgi:hypothetical protein
MTIDERDRVVARALGRLPAPEHGPDFWAGVDARLAAANEPPQPAARDAAVADGDAPVIELRAAERSERSTRERSARRWTRVAPLAVAAAIVAVVAGVLATRDSSDDARSRVVLAAPSETTLPLPNTNSPAPANGADEVAERAAITFIDALSNGDLRTAWDMLGPASRDTWQSFDAFSGARSGFSEGLGTWASASNRTVSTTRVWVDDKTGASLHVVTFMGERRPEGMLTTEPYAMVVRVKSAGGVDVEPFTPHDTVGLRLLKPVEVSPVSSTEDSPVVLETPTGTKSLALVVDADLVSTWSRPSTRVAYSPARGWPRGNHLVTAFAVYADGTPAAMAVSFATG